MKLINQLLLTAVLLAALAAAILYIRDNSHVVTYQPVYTQATAVPVQYEQPAVIISAPATVTAAPVMVPVVVVPTPEQPTAVTGPRLGQGCKRGVACPGQVGP
jgi:hypothetical protein